MNEWLQVALTILGAAGGAYLGISVKVAILAVKVAALEKEIGSQDSGIRGRVQDIGDDLGQLEVRVDQLERLNERGPPLDYAR